MQQRHFSQKWPILGFFLQLYAVFMAIFGLFLEGAFLIFEPDPPGRGPFRSGKNWPRNP
jgi:hypothetical protein